MLRRLLIGPVLTGTGWLAGSYYGSDAQQLVHKSPSHTYDGVAHAIDNMRSSGTTHFEGGTPMPYEIRADRTADQQLLVHLVFNGREGATTELLFTPRNDGKDTLITGKVHSDRSVLREALAGTSSARLAYAPDWMLNLTARPMLRQLAEQIEHGDSASLDSSANPTPPQQLEFAAQQDPGGASQQYQATQPAVDPNAEADTYLAGNSGAE